ncbi:glycoside hydrolase family 13 protein [Gephyromycinifex aptenodytis]|uniref:glycoside hydrolase family 13 protein n=1 Tax=Gephyromycinifex aptenodytis TaxID=2716227 RepID=UPI0014452827|nr:alpha-glucosidase [Gephyromycinifex aptenodytis]
MSTPADDPTPDPRLASDSVAERDWWKSAVVYQIYPRSFADSDGDGVGDLPGILSRLDHLSDLGVDVVWLSPVYRSPMDDNGYDISDYEDIDPLFGSLADIDALIAGLHERGIKLVMDLVVNHTSDEHPWFREARSDPGSAKRDWYWWRPARPGFQGGTPGAEPTNWASFFSGPAWEWDEASQEYYLHLFSRRQPDLNWENPQVRAAVYAMMRGWLERGVDGFRMDVINLISKVVGPNGELADGPQLPGAALGDGSPFYLCGPRIHEFLREMHEQVFADRQGGFLTVGEMPGVTVEQARAFTDPAGREVDMVFQFEHVSLDEGPGGKFDLAPLDLVQLKATLARWQDGLAQVGWNSLYWNNHDQPRAVSRFGDDSPRWRELSAKALATVLHLHRGTPYIYQGEEIGMTNMPFTGIEQVRDIESLNFYAELEAGGGDLAAGWEGILAKGRDNARTPMQWDGSQHAGFTAGTPWLALNPNHDQINVVAQAADPSSVLAHYRRLIDLRHREAVIAHGDFTMLLPDDPHFYTFTRSHQGQELLVVANLSSEPHELPVTAFADWIEAPVLLGNYPDPGPPRGTFRPWEATIYRGGQ